MSRWLKISLSVVMFSALHAGSLNEAFQGLKESPCGFVIVDVGITAQDLENFSCIDIQKEWIHHQFGQLETIQEKIVDFFSEVGSSDNKVVRQAASRLEQVVLEVIEASERETAWICLRTLIPTNRFDSPRWHVDGIYYTPDSPEDLLVKFIVTLAGSSTLFYPLPPELRKTIKPHIQDGQYLQRFCRKESVVSPKIGEGAVFIRGWKSQTPAIHSEPPVHENRLLLTVVPCTKKQLVELEALVLAIYPKGSRN